MYPNNYYHPQGEQPTTQWGQGSTQWDNQPTDWNAHPEQYDAGINSYPEQDYYADTSGCGCGNGTSAADYSNWGGITPQMPIQVPGGQNPSWQPGQWMQQHPNWQPGQGQWMQQHPNWQPGQWMGHMPGPVVPPIPMSSYWHQPPHAGVSSESFDSMGDNA